MHLGLTLKLDGQRAPACETRIVCYFEQSSGRPNAVMRVGYLVRSSDECSVQIIMAWLEEYTVVSSCVFLDGGY